MKGKYLSFHHRFLAWVGRLTNTIILSPHPVALGNAAEDYYCGLIKARRERKKLVVLFPFPMPEPFRIQMLDPAILFLESDLLAMKFRSPVSSVLSGMFTLYFIAVRVLIVLRYKIRPFQAPGYYYRPLAGQDLLWRPDPGVIKFDWDVACKQDWETQFSQPLELSLPGKLVAACETAREKIGLPRDVWFVCLHVREGGYKKDWDNLRNADIANYIGAIKEITRRGGWVVRMGDASMARLPALERVIDYAHSPNRSAIMDVYLLKECAFCVGTSSGVMEMAFALGRPIVKTNLTQWINEMPMRKGDLAIFKHVYSDTEARFISLRDWLNRASLITGEHWSSPAWRLFENSEEEITGVVREKLDLPDNYSPNDLQQEFRQAHLRAAHELSKTLHFDSGELENCSDWFHMASRMLSWRGEVSAEFLEKNWLKSSKTPN